LQNSPIQVGSIDLQDFEIPQSVRFGGRYRVVVHSLGGGGRVVERLGPDDYEIQFRGTFSGPNAEVRARAFDNLRVSGEPVWLTWESFRRRVIITSLVAEYHSPWWIPYQLSCVVVDRPRIESNETVRIVSAMSADLTSALAAAAGSMISLASLQSIVSTPNAQTANTLDHTKARTTVRTTMLVINDQLEQQSAMLIAPIPRTTNPAIVGELYASKVAYAASLAATTNVRSYVGRIGVNLASFGA
jgi:hypothetical protein